MSSEEFRVCVSLRLARAVIPNPPTGFRYMCGLCKDAAPLDSLGHHALSCKGSGHRTAAHHTVARAIEEMARDALFQPQREVRCFVGDAAELKVDLVFMSGPGGARALDVVIVHPFGNPYLARQALAMPGGATKAAAAGKVTKYEEASRAVHMHFTALAMDTAGAWNPEAVSIFKQIGRCSAQHYREQPGYASQLSAARLSVVAQCAIANIILVAVDKAILIPAVDTDDQMVFSGCDSHTAGPL